MSNANYKPLFNVEQVTSASTAAKKFGEIRKKAKQQPQFISDNNNIDTVVLNYSDYEKLYAEVQLLKEIAWEYEITRRVEGSVANPGSAKSLEDILDKQEYERYKSLDVSSISDDDLFEK